MKFSRGSARDLISSIAGREGIAWPRARKISFARTAAPRTPAGPASATLAASGTRWSRKAPKRRGADRGARRRGGSLPSSRCTADRRMRRGCRRGSPNSIASPAAAWSAVRCCCSAAIPASASRRCCLKSPLRSPATSTARFIFPAKKRWRKCGCAPNGSAFPAPRWKSRPKPRSRISSRPCRRASRPGFSSSIRSRRCGRSRSKPRRAP